MIIRKQVVKTETEIDTVTCNFCGDLIRVNSDDYSDYLHIEKGWGYFSNKDNQCHSFDMCGDCYDKMIDNIKISVEITKDNGLDVY